LDKYSELYQKIIAEGASKGIRFDDLRYFLEKTGFSVRINGGDHFKFTMNGITDLINLQPDKKDKKMAKEYQVKQVRKIFKKYKLGGGNDE